MTPPLVERLRSTAGWAECYGKHRSSELMQQAADQLTVLTAALGECQDKLWVLHFSLGDEAERKAALDACNMATAALTGEQG